MKNVVAYPVMAGDYPDCWYDDIMDYVWNAAWVGVRNSVWRFLRANIK